MSMQDLLILVLPLPKHTDKSRIVLIGKTPNYYLVAYLSTVDLFVGRKFTDLRKTMGNPFRH